jgi:hypothetical protein
MGTPEGLGGAMIETTTSDSVLARLEALMARLDEQATRLDEQAAEIANLKAENARLLAARPSSAGSDPQPGGVRPRAGRRPSGAGILNRRGLLAGVMLATAGVLTRAGERVAQAAPIAGDSNNFTPGVTAVNTSTNIALAAVSGQSSPPGLGGPQPVIYGFNNNNQKAIRGSATGISSIGVEGAGGLYGVHGTSFASYGVKGVSVADGPAPSTVAGVWGTSAAATGVFGTSTSGTGVYGESGSGNAVFGSIPSSSAANTIAIYGLNYSSFAGPGPGAGGFGVYGLSAKGHGLVGATAAAGAAALVGATNGVAGAYAAALYGPVLVSGAFTVFGGPKSAAVKHPDGSHRRLYCIEGPEPWFEDFGEGKLVGGKAEVRLDPDFAAVVEPGSYHVFVTEHDDHHALTVKGRGPAGFSVQADDVAVKAKGKQAAQVNGTFSWRVVAKRKDAVGKRLERVEIPAPPALPQVEDRPPRQEGAGAGGGAVEPLETGPGRR